MSKRSRERSEFFNMQYEQLDKKINTELRKELLMLKMGVASGKTKDYAQIKKIRRSIARALTFLRIKQRIQNDG